MWPINFCQSFWMTLYNYYMHQLQLTSSTFIICDGTLPVQAAICCVWNVRWYLCKREYDQQGLVGRVRYSQQGGLGLMTLHRGRGGWNHHLPLTKFCYIRPFSKFSSFPKEREMTKLGHHLEHKHIEYKTDIITSDLSFNLTSFLADFVCPFFKLHSSLKS